MSEVWRIWPQERKVALCASVKARSCWLVLSGTLNCSVGFHPCLCLAFGRPIACTSDSSQVLPKQPDTFSNSIFTPKENKVVCQPAMSLNYYIQYLVSEFVSPNTNSELTANTEYRYMFSLGVLLTSINCCHFSHEAVTAAHCCLKGHK